MKIFPYLMILTLIFSCSGKKDGEVLTLGLIKGVSSLDPALAFDGKSLKLIAQSYEPLYQYHYLIRPFKIIPLLAKDLPEWNSDGTSLTIKIKKGVKYHDHPAFKGKAREMKAKDFINQLKRVAFAPTKSPGFGYFNVIKGFEKFRDIVGNDLELLKSTPITGAKALDDYTLRIDLNKKLPNFTYYLTMHFLVPLPMEVIEYGSLEKNVVGTGPYYFSKIDPENRFVLEKFKGFRPEFYPERGDRFSNLNKLLKSAKEKLPFLSKINFINLDNHEQMWDKFVSGEIDVLEDIPFERMGHIVNKDGTLVKELQEKGIEIKRYSVLINRWLGINMRDPFLGNNKNLRMAIAHAIDFNAYNKLVRKNSSLQANSILTPGIPGYTPGHQLPYVFDIKRAKEYLKNGGYPGGFGLPEFTYFTRNKINTGLAEGKFFKEQLANIGIRINIVPLDFPEFLKKGRNGELQLWTDNWIYDFPDASNILQLLVSKNFPGINKSGVKNIVLDQKFSELEGMAEGNKRLIKVREIEQIFDREVPWIMLSYERSIVLLRKDIKNYRKSGVIRNYFKYITKD